jgi:hypothetical protein
MGVGEELKFILEEQGRCESVGRYELTLSESNGRLVLTR